MSALALKLVHHSEPDRLADRVGMWRDVTARLVGGVELSDCLRVWDSALWDFVQHRIRYLPLVHLSVSGPVAAAGWEP